jgi:CBS domain containing-hemolysin-like protein
MLELALYIFAFIALSGLMAVVEAAVLSISRAEVEELRLQGAWGADALKAITDPITRAVVVLVIFTNTINVVGPILAGRKAMQLYGDFSLAIITAILTLGTIVFSEIIPKSLGTHYAPLISRWAAPAIRLLTIVLYPLVAFLDWLSGLLKSGERRIGTEAQIRSLTTMGRRAGYIESDEGQLIRRAFLLNDRLARDIMTPCKDMVSLGKTDTIRDAAMLACRHAYSRYPVFGHSKNDLTGLVMSNDILKALIDGREQEPVSTICRSGLAVPAGMRSDDLLVCFRDQHIRMAVVQDQQGTVGLVTLNDVLEELVGEIHDEKGALA